jgi:hypothetical protein
LLRRSALALLVLAACAPADPPSDDTDTDVGGGGGDTDATGYPTRLPFTVTRTPAGEPLAADEVAAFTRALTGFWEEHELFAWVDRLTHGYDGPDGPHFGLWHTQMHALRDGDTVTFVHDDWEDNQTIPMSKWMAEAGAAFLVTGDPAARDVLIRQSRGLSALFDGLVWGEPPAEPSPFLARSIYPPDHAFTTVDGRSAAATWADVRHEHQGWNAHTVENADSPYWSPLWVRNMRSKDDVPHIYRAYATLLQVLEQTDDAEVIAAVQPAVDHLRAFATDIVTHGWTIRSVEGGEVFEPTEDLAHLDLYAGIEPDAECTSRLATALIAGLPFGEDCNDGIAPGYETVSASHYYNVAIQRGFHTSALLLALIAGEDEVAEALMDGLVARVEADLDDPRGATEPAWTSDLAGYLVLAQAGGLPLTDREARLVRDEYAATLERYAGFATWDLWADDLPDGELAYLPSRAGAPYVVPIEELAFPLLACASPLFGGGSAYVDCDVVRDRARWGE